MTTHVVKRTAAQDQRDFLEELVRLQSKDRTAGVTAVDVASSLDLDPRELITLMAELIGRRLIKPLWQPPDAIPDLFTDEPLEPSERGWQLLEANP